MIKWFNVAYMPVLTVLSATSFANKTVFEIWSIVDETNAHVVLRGLLGQEVPMSWEWR